MYQAKSIPIWLPRQETQYLISNCSFSAMTSWVPVQGLGVLCRWQTKSLGAVIFIQFPNAWLGRMRMFLTTQVWQFRSYFQYRYTNLIIRKVKAHTQKPTPKIRTFQVQKSLNWDVAKAFMLCSFSLLYALIIRIVKMFLLNIGYINSPMVLLYRINKYFFFFFTFQKTSLLIFNYK